MKCQSAIALIYLSLLSGCGTLNAERESYMQDSLYEKSRYFGDAVSSPEFSHYELRADYKVSDGKFLLIIDPVEIYNQEKELYVIKNEVSYSRHGPYHYSPPMCVISVVTVFNVLFAIIDDDYADRLKESCYKVYEWKKEVKELPPEKVGVKTVNTVRRGYRDSDGKLSFQLMANGKLVNGVYLSGFKRGDRSGPYSWTVNNWYDFSGLENDDSLDVKIVNVREDTSLVQELSIKKEDSESVIFKSKYDGIFQLYYSCRLCNANLTDNFYTDQQVIIWRSSDFLYKGKGSLSRVASCIEDRFDNLRHGNVWVKDAKTPKELSTTNSLVSSAYVMVRGVRAPDRPTAEDIRSCIRKKGVDLEIEEY